uniref:Uncharacterized protein n=1 Tax=Sphaerodactylus townsendi TaxID=933632 RepID=A0ACB8FM50_9SAUR
MHQQRGNLNRQAQCQSAAPNLVLQGSSFPELGAVPKWHLSPPTGLSIWIGLTWKLEWSWLKYQNQDTPVEDPSLQFYLPQKPAYQKPVLQGIKRNKNDSTSLDKSSPWRPEYVKSIFLHKLITDGYRIAFVALLESFQVFNCIVIPVANKEYTSDPGFCSAPYGTSNGNAATPILTLFCPLSAHHFWTWSEEQHFGVLWGTSADISAPQGTSRSEARTGGGQNATSNVMMTCARVDDKKRVRPANQNRDLPSNGCNHCGTCAFGERCNSDPAFFREDFPKSKMMWGTTSLCSKAAESNARGVDALWPTTIGPHEMRGVERSVLILEPKQQFATWLKKKKKKQQLPKGTFGSEQAPGKLAGVVNTSLERTVLESFLELPVEFLSLKLGLEFVTVCKACSPA